MQGETRIVATLPKDFQALGYSANTFRNQCFREAACVRGALRLAKSRIVRRPATAGLGLWLADRLGEMNNRAGVVQTFCDLHEIHLFAISQKFTRGHRNNSNADLRASTETFGD